MLTATVKALLVGAALLTSPADREEAAVRWVETGIAAHDLCVATRDPVGSCDVVALAFGLSPWIEADPDDWALDCRAGQATPCRMLATLGSGWWSR